ncbi:carboxylesterase/lipase family protein [Ensifer sp. ENS05]|uniref:carboxylesterase family protein n=1 Tax=Ensifer sp. ENS05 TaxID=2769277 RepID=UPI001782B1E6|nr:carboxylesterase family protein [Ensifer sp. ENS05]MBD9596895.1 carboxylesterase/lipase family protein [Ensifer sp. ENS05]
MESKATMKVGQANDLGNVDQTTEEIVVTRYGPLCGRRTHSGVVFRGVPYGDKVSTNARFSASTPVAPWSGLRLAHTDGPAAPQRPSRLENVMGKVIADQGEDCLTMTIWTPDCAPSGRPVVIWFHGGAYISGAGTLSWYDGERLSSRGDLVVVSVNHRLGALGYLVDPAHPQSPAVEDQRLAVEWVHRNISMFGGDPDSITLMGQSAGAVSIANLIQCERTARMVKRVILQSGGFGRDPLLLDRASEVRRNFLNILADGAEIAHDEEFLKAASVEDILVAQADTMSHFGGDLVFRPLSPGDRKWGEYIESIAAACKGIDVMISVTAEEGRSFVPASVSMADVKRSIAAQSDEQTFETYRKRYPSLSARDLLTTFLTDYIYCGGNLKLGRMISSANNSVYCCVFDWSPAESDFGACHCIELPFVFGTLDAWPDAGMLKGGDDIQMGALSADVQANWISFIRNGRPEDGEWAPFDSTSRVVRRFGSGAKFADKTCVDAWLAARA